MEHIDNYRIKRFNYFFDSSSNRSHVINEILDEFEKNWVEKYNTKCSDDIINALYKVLKEISTFNLLNFVPSVENVENRIIDKLNEELIERLSKRSEKFADMVAERPTLSEDKYWGDWCYFWQVLAISLGGSVDSWGDGEYTFGQRFMCDEDKLEEDICRAMPSFFGKYYNIDGKGYHLTDKQFLEKVSELLADEGEHNISFK